MDKDKTETSIRREIEEGRMKQELQDMGMYEKHYTYTHMKKILGFISESKEMANRSADIKSERKEISHPSNDFALETITKTDSTYESDTEEHQELSKSSLSGKTYHISAAACDRKSSCGSRSPELPAIFDKSSMLCSRKSSDSDDIFEKSYEKQNVIDNNSYGINKSLSLYRSKNLDIKMDLQLEQKEKLCRWQIDPLDSYVFENDVPLQQPSRPPAEERIPLRLCKDMHTSKKCDNLLSSLNNHLKEVADLWHSWHCTESKVQWGSPIQVDIANSSLDRKLQVDTMSESNEIEYSSKNSHNRASKRKAALIMSSVCSMTSSSEEENDKANFISIKKKKVENINKVCKVPDITKQEIKQNSNLLSQVEEKEHSFKDNDDVTKNVENINVKNPKMVEHKPDKRDTAAELCVYPRKIVPPNPRRSLYTKKKKIAINTSLKRNKSFERNREDEEIASISKDTTKSNDKEILKDLRKESNTDKVTITKKDVVIKPLPMKILSVRLSRQCAILKQIDTEKKEKIIAAQKEAQRKKDQEKEIKNEEFIKRRILEMAEISKKEDEMERKEQEKHAKWSEILHQKNKMRMLKHSIEDEQKQKPEKLLQDKGNTQIIKETMNTDYSIEDKIVCPICNKLFASDKIENHAALCEQFVTDSEEEQNNTDCIQKGRGTKKDGKDTGAIYECNICLSFKTNNGIDYEDHVNTCIQRQRNSSPEGSTDALIDIPTSPVRSYRPISEQKNAHIDYSGQLASFNKKQTHFGKKRKR